MSNVPELRFKEFSGDWEKKRLKEVTSYVDYRGRAPIKTEKGHFLVTAKNIKKGFIDYECSKEYVAENNYLNVMSKGLPEVGDILFTTEAPMGNVAQVDNKDIALAQRVIKFRGKEMLLNSYLLHYMLSTTYQNLISRKSIGTTVQGISGKELHKTRISFPSPKEQEKIASFLTSVDTKIEQLTQKESLLKEYKKGMMQKIFNQEIRFKDDDGSEFCEWEKEKLGKYLVEYKVKSILENEYPVFTSSNKGLMLQSDYFGENRLTERDNIGFNVVPNNHITYRSRSDNRTFTFNMNTLGFTGVISTYYPVFESKNGDNRFIVTLLNENKHFIGRYSVGTSQTVLSFNELKNIKMFIPTPKEQTKISDFLSSIDKKIENAKDEVEKTKEFKKALLQQMFV